MLKVYLGYDQNEHEAYEVAQFSLTRRSTLPVLVAPLYSQNPLYQRTFHKREDGQRIDDLDGRPFSTEFSFARFLVPAAEKYTGWAIFADCDFLFLGDVAELTYLMDPRYAVRVVKHVHAPKDKTKMQGQEQTQYERKNWSSFILWNCGHEANRMLTPDLVNSAAGIYLHRFQWLAEELIGDLPVAWNHLVDYNDHVDPFYLKALHYTSGGPWFERYRNCGYADLWRKELALYNANKFQHMRRKSRGVGAMDGAAMV